MKKVTISGLTFILQGCKSLTRQNFDLYYSKPKNHKGGEIQKDFSLDRTWTTLQEELKNH